tara:strand:+ start:6712 stop:7116 length:405 start_codon:yes stop_codon:yes gene_type:complete
MRYDLQDIWCQALDDDFATDINGQGYESRLVYGVKIIRDNVSKEVQILKAMTGSEYYPNLSKDEIEVFLDKGWRYGIYSLSLASYRTKLENIKEAIKSEVNGRNRIKRLYLYKESRDGILKKYNNINNKLNQLK